jgi:hypothetical protein
MRIGAAINVLISILSCHRYNERRNAQRETWLNEMPLDYRFFLGRVPEQLEHGPRPTADQVFLDVSDDYGSLPFKTLAMLAWAYARGYEYVFKCDDDTYCRTDRLLASGFENHDYSGFQKMSPYFGKPGVDFAQGGAGYWLSRRAIAIVLQEEETKRPKNLCGGPEDINVARILKDAHVPLFDDQRYRPGVEFCPRPDNDSITAHKCTVDDMREMHRAFQPILPTASFA